jgi:regulation of enolase protein 1 (concanavalin A-like superfamily)
MRATRRDILAAALAAPAIAAGASAAVEGAKPAPPPARGGGDLLSRMSWLNPPAQESYDAGRLTMRSKGRTDFWRKTFYGYITDNGHVLYKPVSGDFASTVRVAGDYAALYDQAGIMVRYDESNWMKCGVEFVGGRQNISTVITRDYSDWSAIALPDAPAFLWIRVSRKGGALTIAYSRDGKKFEDVRQGWLSPAPSLDVGLMCAAPEGPGFEARFESWTTTPA